MNTFVFDRLQQQRIDHSVTCRIISYVLTITQTLQDVRKNLFETIDVLETHNRNRGKRLFSN